jgi:hypothetical protein
MGAKDPGELDACQVGQIVAESYGYFMGRNWYRLWFGWLERLLTDSGAGSSLDGSACHLDLVQWATKPAQGELPAGLWQRLEDRLEYPAKEGTGHLRVFRGASDGIRFLGWAMPPGVADRGTQIRVLCAPAA